MRFVGTGWSTDATPVQPIYSNERREAAPAATGSQQVSEMHARMQEREQPSENPASRDAIMLAEVRRQPLTKKQEFPPSN